MASRTRLPSKISGQVVKVSGEHVYVESGVHVVVPDVSVSGSIVQISGQHVFVESGVHVVSEGSVSGQPVTVSGDHVYVESGVHVIAESGLGVLISGQHVYVESGVFTIGGFTSGAYFASGIGVQIQSGAGVLISGQHVFVESGVYLASGIFIAGGGATTSAEVHVMSGEVRALISGDHVFMESGAYLASGIFVVTAIASGTYMASGVGVIINSGVGVTVQSGLSIIPQSGVYVASGIYTASGVGVTIQSGVGVQIQSGAAVQIQSGAGVLISGQHVYAESGVFVLISGQMVQVASGIYLASGLKVGVSGEFIPVGGMDYIQSGNAVMGSGQYRMATTMKGLESAVSGWEGFAEEARLFTGADAKHIRFHDIFDAVKLDPVKWYVEAGTATVAGGLVDLYDAAQNTTVYSRKQFLYGVLSLKVYADDWTEVVCGFLSTYTQDIPPGGPPGPNQSQITFDADNFTVEAIGNGETNVVVSPALVDATFYDIDLVWTPSYAQLWIDGVLRHTVNTPSVPGNPTQIYLRTTTGHHLYVASVSLKPYGDIPLSVRGAVPVAGIDLSGQYVPIAVDASGNIQISGQHVYVESGVNVVGSFTANVSGQPVTISGDHVYVESGVYLASGIYVVAAAASGTYTASGIGVIINSGVGVTVQSGVYLASGLWLASGIIVTVSGNVVSILGAPSVVLAQCSNNPMVIGALSGGLNLISAACVSVTVKALSINSGDIYLGGGAAGHMPYSGQGFVLEPGEAINIDVNNLGLVRCFAEVSADRLTYIAVNI